MPESVRILLQQPCVSVASVAPPVFPMKIADLHQGQDERNDQSPKANGVAQGVFGSELVELAAHQRQGAVGYIRISLEVNKSPDKGRAVGNGYYHAYSDGSDVVRRQVVRNPALSCC